MQFMGSSVRTESATPTDPYGIDAARHLALLSFHTTQHTSTLFKPFRSKRTLASVPCSTKRSDASAHNTFHVPQTDYFSPVAPMTRPRPVDPVRAIVESAVPGIRVEAISRIPSKRLVKSFKVKLVDGGTLLLTLSPPSPRFLRSEQWLMQSEAALLEWLIEDTTQFRERNTGYFSERHTTGKRLQEESSCMACTQHSAPDASPPFRVRLFNYLPTLVKHSSNVVITGSTFNLFHPTPGDILSSLEEPLTQTEQNSICFQKGQLIRHIANVTSPNGRFGIPVTVLGRPRTHGATPGWESELDFDGADSWRKTFHLLLEGILRDGEDLAVMMSYELVRRTFRKYSHLLDAVTTPRLVVYDAGENDNVLVSRLERTSQGQEEHRQKRDDTPEMAAELSDSQADTLDGSEELGKKETTEIHITGLRDWSNCIFGDPLFATIFPQATSEFHRGFQLPWESSTINNKKNDGGDETKGANVDIIEDPENAPIRILLYECYHATVSIVRQFYQPDADSSRREIAARRRLAAALAKLDNVTLGRTAGKRHRRGSDEGPAKRPRGDTPNFREWSDEDDWSE